MFTVFARIAFDGETNPPNRTENDTSPGVPTDPEDNFGYVLFDNLDLVDHGDHTVVIANAAGDSSEGGRNVTYIDYMLFSTEIPGIVSDVVIDDSDEAFSYSQEGWVADRTDQGTVHYTTTRNASATLTFQGTRVILYGTVGSTGSPYSILIRSPDVGGSGTNPGWSGEFNGTRPGFGYRPGEILFYKDDLANGTYEMTITALQDGVANTSSVANVSGSNPLQTLSIDYAIVDGYASGALAPVSSPSGGLSKKLSNQDIAGIVIGGVGALVIIGAAICWILYRGCCGRRILGGSGRSGRHKVRRTRSNASLGLEIQPFSFDPVSLRSVPDVARQPSNFDMKKRRDSGESGHTSDDSYADDPTVEGYPAERERLKQEVAAREASRAEAEAIEPLPTYQYQV
ncbi:hypothetical protein GYMLUDRAFT_398568 [Collybiopsis luxurians FD-317 M1]|nr:hypothetical protein GYMLUDRAFT_398568 [Collybiopsis luxurians FD-317 M1]